MSGLRSGCTLRPLPWQCCSLDSSTVSGTAAMACSAPSCIITTASAAFFAATTEHSMSNSSHYDVIIIGTGAGGGTLAAKLAPTGKRILLLERGGYVPREKDNWNP